MKIRVRFFAPVLALILVGATTASVCPAQGLVKGKDGKTIGYTDTPMLPWSPQWHKHDANRPQPPKVNPGPANSAPAPSDAIVLFDGKDTARWKPNNWKIADGTMTVGDADIETLDSFGDCQLHLEWSAPNPPQGEPLNRGNSGVFMMGRYEIQICDSYTEAIYPDGSAASVYGETPPLVNAMRPPGEWQSYDIFFTRPKFVDGKVSEPAHLTMLHNGVLVHLNTEIHGPVSHRTIAPYEAHGDKEPLKLQSHHNPVKFRNVWIRPL